MTLEEVVQGVEEEVALVEIIIVVGDMRETLIPTFV